MTETHEAAEAHDGVGYASGATRAQKYEYG
jgi:hypothetical protein